MPAVQSNEESLEGSNEDSGPTRIVFKIHRRNRSEILAVCDFSLLGQTISNDRARVKISEQFYLGQEISADDALALFRNYGNINAFGSVLELAIQKQVITEEACVWFKTSDGKRIPHLLIFSIPPI